MLEKPFRPPGVEIRQAWLVLPERIVEPERQRLLDLLPGGDTEAD
ncbi:hypothetical protein [Amycolatopsis sp. WGS_07]